jgi:hypothetical protein
MGRGPPLADSPREKALCVEAPVGRVTFIVKPVKYACEPFGFETRTMFASVGFCMTSNV